MEISFRNWRGEHDEMEVPDDHLILGDCLGIALLPRGNNDNHICLQLIGEDDGNWSVTTNSFSSFWVEDLQRVVNHAIDWLENNAEKDPSGYGYIFKE